MFVLIHFHILCEIRAYIYEKVVKCFYDFLRVANSFSVSYDSFMQLSFLFFFDIISFMVPRTRRILLLFLSNSLL